MNPQQDKNQIQVHGLSFDPSDQKFDKAFELDDSLNTYNVELYKNYRYKKTKNSLPNLQWKKNNWSSGWASGWSWGFSSNRNQMVQRIHRTASGFVRNKNCTLLRISSTENSKHINNWDKETFSVHLDPIIYKTFGEADAAEPYTIDAIAQVISLSDKNIDNSAYNKILPDGYCNTDIAIRLILVEYIRQKGLIALAETMPGWRSRIEAFKTKSDKKGKTYASNRILLLLKAFGDQESQIPAKDRKAALAIKQRIKDQLSPAMNIHNFNASLKELYDEIKEYLTLPTPEAKIITLAECLKNKLNDLKFPENKKAAHINKYGISAATANQLISQLQRLEDMILIYANYTAIKGHQLLNDKMSLAFIKKAINLGGSYYQLAAKSNRTFYPATTRKLSRKQLDENLELKLQNTGFCEAHLNTEKTLFALRACQDLVWSMSENGTFALNHQEQVELLAERDRLVNERNSSCDKHVKHIFNSAKSIMACIALPGDTPLPNFNYYSSSSTIERKIKEEISNYPHSYIFSENQDFDVTNAKLLIETNCKFKSKKAFEKAKHICLASGNENANYRQAMETLAHQLQVVNDKISKIPSVADFRAKPTYCLRIINNLLRRLNRDLEDKSEAQSLIRFEHNTASSTSPPPETPEKPDQKQNKKGLGSEHEELFISEEPKAAEEDDILGEESDPTNTQTTVYILEENK
jgi:cell fate (sporulation/competence/biofilm development) regulator YmcA (YheA/YmcA/DUF963 family)